MALAFAAVPRLPCAHYVPRRAPRARVAPWRLRAVAEAEAEVAAIDEEAAGENKLINDCRTKLEEIKAAMEEAINEERADKEEPEDGWPEIVIENS